MKKAYSYIRFSTKGQIDGRSLARQTERAKRYCDEHDLDLQDLSFSDLGVSGFRGKNASEGALGQFLEAVKEKKIRAGSWLILESFDRLSRQPVEDALPRLLDIVRLGINVVTLEDGMVYKKEGLNTQNLMISLVRMERAHSESKRKSDLLSDVWRNKFKNAPNRPTKGVLPAWLTYNEDKTEIHVIEPKARVVQMIFLFTVNGMGRATIVRELNNLKIPPLGKAKIWHTSYISKLQTSRAVLGEYHPHSIAATGKREPTGQVIKDYYPAIIEESMWLKAQAAINQRKVSSTGSVKKGINRNLFSGFTSCECGASLNFVNKGKGSKGGYYLVCSVARYGQGCQYVGHRYFTIQWVVLIALQRLLHTFTRQPENNDREIHLEGEKANIQSAADRLVDHIAEYGGNQRIQQKLNEHEARLREIDKELKELKSNRAAATESVDIEDLTGKINDQFVRLKLHQFLQRQIEDIIVYKDKHHVDIKLSEGQVINLSYNPETDEWEDGQGLVFKIDRDTRWT